MLLLNNLVCFCISYLEKKKKKRDIHWQTPDLSRITRSSCSSLENHCSHLFVNQASPSYQNADWLLEHFAGYGVIMKRLCIIPICCFQEALHLLPSDCGSGAAEGSVVLVCSGIHRWMNAFNSLRAESSWWWSARSSWGLWNNAIWCRWAFRGFAQLCRTSHWDWRGRRHQTTTLKPVRQPIKLQVH